MTMASAFGLAMTGDLVTFLKAEKRAGERALAGTIRRRTFGCRNALRRDVRRLGARLPQTIKAVTVPRSGNPSDAPFFSAASPHGFVYSIALYKRPGGLVDLWTVLDEGVFIRAHGRRWLAIPTAAAGQHHGRGGGRPWPAADFPGDRLKFVPAGFGAPARLIDPATGVVMFVLVKTVTESRKVDVTARAEEFGAGIDDEIVATWDRELGALGIA
jgi:hypothetical protein